MHLLHREIVLPIAADTLWDFVATPANLNAITPPDLQFALVSDPPPRMFNGLIIAYRIRIPWFGSHHWLTEIKHIREGIAFVDEQRRGPYRFWYHYHEITPIDAQHCRMLDRVHYALPLGILGQLVDYLVVRKLLARIFDYREERLHALFPPQKPEPSKLHDRVTGT